MSGIKQPFRLYASMARTGTTLPFTFLFYHGVQHNLCQIIPQKADTIVTLVYK